LTIRQIAIAMPLAAAILVPASEAQELVPAAYVPAPYGINLVTLTTALNRGDLAFDPSGPIDEANGDIATAAIAYGRTFGLAGRSANIGIALPGVDGSLEGLYLGEPASADRTGFGDASVRLAVNLFGAPAMSPAEFATYRPTTLVGASLVIKAPTGQYDSTRLINIGTNRWSFKPEVGVVQVIGKWALDAYLGAWFFTDNDEFFGGTSRHQDPVITTQFHVRRRFSPRVWAAADANFWYGGQTTIDGRVNDDLQRNSRVGLTVVWTPRRGHTLRFAASSGAITRIGGDFDSFGFAYGYSWRGKP
jgi:hypothetical protein